MDLGWCRPGVRRPAGLERPGPGVRRRRSSKIGGGGTRMRCETDLEDGGLERPGPADESRAAARLAGLEGRNVRRAPSGAAASGTRVELHADKAGRTQSVTSHKLTLNDMLSGLSLPLNSIVLGGVFPTRECW